MVSNNGTTMRSTVASEELSRSKRAAHQTALLLQEEHFQKVADALGVADDVVADRLGAERGSQFARLLEDRKLTAGSVTIGDPADTQGSRVLQLLQQ